MKFSPTTAGIYRDDADFAPEDAVAIDQATFDAIVTDLAQPGKELINVEGTPTVVDMDIYRHLDTAETLTLKTELFITNFNDDSINDEPDQAHLDALSVADLKKLRAHQITVRFNHAMDWILNSYVQHEIDSWSEQKIDADKWQTYIDANTFADTDTETTVDFDSTPMIKELAKGKANKTDATLTVADVNEYKDAIISKSGFFRPYSGGLVGIKKRLLKTIEDQLDDFSGEGDPAAAEQAAKDVLKAIDSSEILAAGYAYILENS